MNYLGLSKIVVCSLIALLLAITPLIAISEEISQYITLEVYADGCISVTARLETVQNTSIPGYLLANATVMVESSRVTYEGFLGFYQPATVSQLTTPFYLFIEGNWETHPFGENIASTGWIKFIARGGTPGNTIDISVNAPRINSTYYTGNQTITASGRVEASGYIESSSQRMDVSSLIPMLLFQIQSYLSMSNMSRYVKLETSQSISSGVAVVEFNVAVVLTGLYSMQVLNKSRALINATNIIKPHPLQLYLKLIAFSNSTGASASLMIRGVEEVNANEYLVQLATLILTITSLLTTVVVTELYYPVYIGSLRNTYGASCQSNTAWSIATKYLQDYYSTYGEAVPKPAQIFELRYSGIHWIYRRAFVLAIIVVRYTKRGVLKVFD